MTQLHALFVVMIAAGVTLLLRAMPFLVFRGETPRALAYLGRVLPYAVMAMLVVYCFKGLSFAAARDWVPGTAAAGVVAALHKWKHETLLSILGGTLAYMVLVQLVFS